jgi:hypothetical protein
MFNRGWTQMNADQERKQPGALYPEVVGGFQAGGHFGGSRFLVIAALGRDPAVRDLRVQEELRFARCNLKRFEDVLRRKAGHFWNGENIPS